MRENSFAFFFCNFIPKLSIFGEKYHNAKFRFVKEGFDDVGGGAVNKQIVARVGY